MKLPVPKGFVKMRGSAGLSLEYTRFMLLVSFQFVMSFEELLTALPQKQWKGQTRLAGHLLPIPTNATHFLNRPDIKTIQLLGSGL